MRSLYKLGEIQALPEQNLKIQFFVYKIFRLFVSDYVCFMFELHFVM